MNNAEDHQIVWHFSTPALFRNRLNSTIPAVAAGVYVVWCVDQLNYAGMSGKRSRRSSTERNMG